MSPSIEPILLVIHKKLQQEPLSAEEEQLLNNWLQQQGEGIFNSDIEDEELRAYLAMRMDENSLQKAIQQFRNTLSTAHSQENIQHPVTESVPDNPSLEIANRRIRRLQWSLAAAVCLLCASAIALLWVTKQAKQKPETAIAHQPVPHDALPGSDKAILTMANGKTIELDNTKESTVQEGSLQVVNKGGQLNYEGTSREVAYHTLSTPRGGQFKLLLPDGTAVWLNAASSITYPTAFTGNNRTVTITGELYFEVAKDKTKPFIVKANGMEATVLGTHFNINAYDDEPTKQTTLLEGSVKVVNRQSAIGNAPFVVLTPGRQAVLTADSRLTTADANIEEVMAWKNGAFQFNRTSLQIVMRQLSRWYDVDIVYEKDVPNITFEGDMKRNLNLSQVLEGLGKMGVHFKIEGKKLIVTP